MRAISFYLSLPAENPESLVDVEVDKPMPGPRDILVQIHGISVNPVDTKVRKGSAGPGKPSGESKILGWDAAGIVTEIGSEVTFFASGDEVYYAGAINRPGSYAQFQAVDERIVGPQAIFARICRRRRAAPHNHYGMGINFRPSRVEGGQTNQPRIDLGARWCGWSRFHRHSIA